VTKKNMAKTNQAKQEVHSKLYEDCLPKHWGIAHFDEIAFATDYVANGSFASLKQNVTYKKEPDYAILVRLTDFHKGWNNNYVYVDKHAYNFLAKSSLEPGDIVISNVGDPGKVFQVPNLNQPMTLGPNSILIKVYKGIEKSFIAYFFMSPWGQDLIRKIVTGTAQKKFNKTNLRQTFLPITPENEQKSIVEEIEKQFSRLDEAVENLKRVKANLKRYKASVLKAAVEGKLTEEWREKHPDVEPADQLLERILVERRKKWEEAELAKMEAKGKTPKDDKWKKKYKEPIASEAYGLSMIPNSWVWTNIGHITETMKNGIYKPRDAYNENGVACLRMYNIDDGKIVWKNIKRMKLSDAEIEEYKLLPGDLLVNRVNSRELVGKAAPITDDLELCVFESKNIRVRILADFIFPEFVAFRMFVEGQSFFNRNAQQVVGMASISQSQLASLPIPLLPINEQKVIITKIQKHISIIDKIENEIIKNLQRAERLRQSILKKAFSGKL
jgi:type I restriction enzyme, S subunit